MTIPRISPVTGQRPRPLWSVMIPTCNPDLAHLRATMESVFASGLPAVDRQVALVDDATKSSDFDAFVEEMRARGVEIIRNNERVGLAGNWNRCLAHARGHWVHLLHQDDRIRPGYYAAMADGIWSDANIGAAFCQAEFVDTRGHVTRTGHVKPRTAGVVHDWIEHIIVNLAVQCPCIVVRRAVYERLGGFDDAYAYCLDGDMWQRIAAEYPVWYDPRPLGEFREHEASASRRLFDLSSRWRERAACAASGIQRLSPPVRAQVERSARHYRARLAAHEFLASWRKSSVAARLKALMALAFVVRISDVFSILRGHYPKLVPGRAPARGSDAGAPRAWRILLISEFFPAEPERFVFGGIQRLRRHVEAMGKIGHIDAAFLWPDNHQMSGPDIDAYRNLIQPTWPIDGQMTLITAESGPQAESRRHPLRAVVWMLRGAASFFHTQPTMRSCGRRQAARLRETLLACQPDLIFAHRLGAMGALIRANQPLPPVVLDMDDLEHVRLTRITQDEKGALQKLRSRLWIWIARHVTRRATKQADVTLICSDHDRAILAAMAPTAHLKVVPNSARNAKPMPRAPGPTAMFVGVAHYAPNSHAIRRLVHELWPRVRRLVPDAQLTIVGEGATNLAASDPDAGYTVLDFVSDLAGIYRDARIAVCPITLGGGTRIKIIEAAMYARPVVSTSIGAEGLTFVPDSEILIADDSDEFAQRCAELLVDADRCETIGRAARARALAEYSPDRIASGLAEIMSGVLENNLPGPVTRPAPLLAGEVSCRHVPNHLSS